MQAEDADVGNLSEEEEPDPEPKPAPAARGRTRRTNVFVEPVQLDDDWVPPSYDKTDEEKVRLEGYIGKTALLQYLDTKAKQTVIGAFQKKNYSAGENIITQVRQSKPNLVRDSAQRALVLSTPDFSIRTFAQ